MQIIKKYNSISLIIRIICGLVIGVILGLLFKNLQVVPLLGSIFVNALKAIAPVLVFVLVVSALAQGNNKLDSRFGLVIALYMISTLLASLFAVVASFIFPQTLILVETATAEAVPTMMALNIFNRMIDCAIGEDGEGGGTFIEYGDFSLALNPEIEDKLYNLAIERTKGYVKDFDDLSFEEQTALLHQYGKYSVQLGNRVSNGSPYLLSPDEHGMIKMEVKTNQYKPYLGLGYGGSLSRKSDSYRISFECGAMYWGNSPSIIMHDGMDIMHDVTNLNGKIGEYCDISRRFKVFPIVNLRLTHRFFL